VKPTGVYFLYDLTTFSFPLFLILEQKLQKRNYLGLCSALFANPCACILLIQTWPLLLSTSGGEFHNAWRGVAWHGAAWKGGYCGRMELDVNGNETEETTEIES